MIEEKIDLQLGDLLDCDINLDQLFSGVIGVAPLVQQQKKEQPKIETLKNNDWSDLDVKDEVYSQRPLNQRKRIRKVENKVWKDLKKSRNDTYIRMLENKVQHLEKQISKQKAINKSNQAYIKKLSLSEQIISGVFVGRSQIYERLESLTELQETQETRKEIAKQITSLRYRLGVQGKDRIKSLNHYFKQMVESFIPECQRFLIYAACKEVQFFSPQYIQSGIIKYEQDDQWRQLVVGPLSLSYQQRKTISNLKPSIIQQKQKYDNLVHQLFQTKKALTQQAKKLEIIFDQFRAFVSPCQMGKILVTIQKNKYRKQLNLQNVDSFWSYQFQRDDTKYQTKSLFSTFVDGSWQ